MAKKVDIATSGFGFSTDKNTIEAMIANIAARTASIRTDVQAVAVSCTVHAALHGDVGPMRRLDDALGTGSHRQSFRMWAVKYGCFGFRLADGKDGAKGFTHDGKKAAEIKLAYESDADACIKALMAKPWHEAAPEPQFEGFDLVKIIRGRINKAKKIAADPTKANHPKTSIDMVLLGKLEALIERGGATLQ